MDELEQAKHSIAIAAEDAIRTVASAAEKAAAVIASAASAAECKNNVKAHEDHDLLIELKTRMLDLKDDIKDLKDGTSVKINDHEKRLFDLEKSKGTQTTLLSIGIAILSLLTTILIYHIVK